MDFNEKIYNLRKSLNFTMQELADKIGVSAATIKRYESGEIKNVRRDKIKLLADALDVTPAYLMDWQPENIPSKDERDIAKQMKEIKMNLEECEGLSFMGEPLSNEAKESLLTALEFMTRQTKQINKKYIPKKYIKGDKDK